MLLSAILMIVGSVVDAKACDDMAAMVTSSDRQEASSPEQIVADITKAVHPSEFAKPDLHHVDGCVPQCCQGSVCCHLLPISPLPGFWAGHGDDVVALVSTDGTVHSAEPDVPPPKTI